MVCGYTNLKWGLHILNPVSPVRYTCTRCGHYANTAYIKEPRSKGGGPRRIGVYCPDCRHFQPDQNTNGGKTE